MGYVFSTSAGLIALFAMMVEASIAVILAFSTGLSEMHKDLLVGFAVGFPALMLIVILLMLARAQAALSSSEDV
ncbi:MAG: hypothetical protein E6Q73_04115 [Pseudorhodobacter sp.]|nr:MAG: hypothetical protein E6Q73_04115 [Pseudorhodobacter sp.]